jgi:hypothetical protein
MIIDPVKEVEWCPYEQIFLEYRQPDNSFSQFPEITEVRRSCIKDAGHSGNHIVIEPLDDTPMECPR